MRPLADLRSAMLDDDHEAMDSAVDELLTAGCAHDEIVDHIALCTADWLDGLIDLGGADR